MFSDDQNPYNLVNYSGVIESEKGQRIPLTIFPAFCAPGNLFRHSPEKKRKLRNGYRAPFGNWLWQGWNDPGHFRPWAPSWKISRYQQAGITLITKYEQKIYDWYIMFEMRECAQMAIAIIRRRQNQFNDLS